ncbi:MFS-type transporter SLC18B1 [Amphibalanus amphitrite]|uniref:MFS-type transporter SLC18B1 n=1 Tax=Amphibalanus amphitrite TaxID=1232801 RepID=A0A6A4X8E6_AMPAM|nr:MFS-type transporter SLC18B1 [Amphibalanus amphitrite]
MYLCQVAESKGFSASVYGAIIGTNCLVSFVVTPFLGRHIETIGVGFSLMFGPGLGGIFYELGGFYMPFVVFGALHLVTLMPLVCVLPDRPEAMLRIPGIWVAFVSFLVSTLSTGFLSITLEAQILRKYELSHISLGMMFGLKDGASSITSPIWGLLCDKFRCVKAYVVVTSLTAAVCFAVFGPLPGVPIHQTLGLLITALSLYGVAIGGMQVSGMVDALREATGNGMADDPTTHGVVAGMWSSLSGAGRFISRCGAGILVDTIGFPRASCVVVTLHALMAWPRLRLHLSVWGEPAARAQREAAPAGGRRARAAAPRPVQTTRRRPTPVARCRCRWSPRAARYTSEGRITYLTHSAALTSAAPAATTP